ncbi:hypothetical protein ACHAPA_011304 [Fusarium lateritium]
MNSTAAVSTVDVLMVMCKYCEPVSNGKVELQGVSNSVKDSESVEAVKLGTERLGKADVDCNSVKGAVVADDSDSKTVLKLELIESVERDMRIVEPAVVSSAVNAVSTEVDNVGNDVEAPDSSTQQVF